MASSYPRLLRSSVVSFDGFDECEEQKLHYVALNDNNNNNSPPGGLSEVNQIRPLGTDKSPVSTDRGRNSRPSERVINRVLFRAGLKDHIGLRRQSGAQLSFSAHFSHCSALQFHLVAQQLPQRRRVTTPASFLTCF